MLGRILLAVIILLVFMFVVFAVACLFMFQGLEVGELDDWEEEKNKQ